MKSVAVAISLLTLSGCVSDPIKGLWMNSEYGDITKYDLKNEGICTVSISPKNHSTFYGKCEYAVTDTSVEIHILDRHGKRDPDGVLLFEKKRTDDSLELVEKKNNFVLRKQ